jgi:hypothetical protein
VVSRKCKATPTEYNYSKPNIARMRLVSTIPLLLLCVYPAFSWGCLGHRTIALIAFEQLTPHSRDMASHLLEGEPAGPSWHSFCGSSDLVPFAQTSTWADDIRRERKDTGSWHFIDIPLDANRAAITEDCPAASGCVTSAIRRQIEVLRSASAGKQEQAEALMFLVHFVGDLHQPLHAADNDDRGGNCVAVALFDRRPEPAGADQNYRPNLHGVWDTDLVDLIAGQRDATALAETLRADFAPEMKRWKLEPIDVDEWAWQSHELAVEVAYGKLPNRVPVEAPRPVESCADRDMGKRMYELHEEIGEQYEQAATPVIRRQLALAGTRLAMLLNQIWP